MLFSHSTPQSDVNAPCVISGPLQQSAVSHPCFTSEPDLSHPAFVSSIAETAGLNRFVYLIGKSRQRYVFSVISKGQMSLYYDAVFAIVEGDDKRLWVGNYSRLVRFLNNNSPQERPQIFVHLLAEGIDAKSHIISDLSRVANN